MVWTHTILNDLIIDCSLLFFSCRGTKLYLDTCHRLMVLISCLGYSSAPASPLWTWLWILVPLQPAL